MMRALLVAVVLPALTSALSSPSPAANRQLVLGGAGLVALAANRFFLAGSLPPDSQSRADLLCLGAMCGLLLDGLSVRDVETAKAAQTTLRGRFGASVARDLSRDQLVVATWAASAAVDALPAASTVVIWRQRRVLVRYGLLGDADLDLEAPTFREALLNAPQETYLPDLQALPARVEFGCLPRATPAALILPLTPEDGLLVGCRAKRALTPKDIAWLRIIAIQVFQTAERKIGS